MGTQRKPLEHRSAKKVGTVRVNRDSATGRFSVSGRKDSEAPYKPETVERLKALADAPASGETMDGDDYLRWLNG